jgi:hypothetical protein
MSRHMMSAAAVVAVMLGNGVASADMSRGVIAAFHGQLVISKDELPEGKNDKETIAKIKAAQVKELIGSPKADVTGWRFHYTAFPSRTGATTLKMLFYTDDKDHRYVADQRLDGVDPKSAVLTGDISIDEDEGLAKGKAYIIKLETDKDVVVAQASVVMK